MRTKEVLVIGILFALAIGFTYFYQGNSDDIVTEDKVCFNSDCVFVNVADDEISRAQGLMNVEQMDSDKGMFFVFESVGNYPFWMKNTLIPLDMIWIGVDQRVVAIKNAVPCEEDPCDVYNPNANAIYVLEVNSGKVSDWGLEVGDKLDIYVPVPE